jgi:hypothetical protein
MRKKRAIACVNIDSNEWSRAISCVFFFVSKYFFLLMHNLYISIYLRSEANNFIFYLMKLSLLLIKKKKSSF